VVRKSKRQRKRAALEIVKDKYPVALFENDDGNVEHRAMVPMTEAVTLADDARKFGLIARVSAAVRGWFRPRTSAADDVGTTDLGSTASAITVGNGFFTSNMHKFSKEENTRKAKYTDYMKIDEECTELTRALSVTVSNVFTAKDGDEGSYKIKSQDERVVKIIEDVDQRTEMQTELPGVCRSMLRLGDDFEEIVVDQALSVIRIKWLNQKYMYRREDEFGRLQEKGAFEMRSEDDHQIASFEPWQVVHLRYDHQRGDLYGRSFFFAARKSWRLLQMMEDGVVMGRLVRSVDRLVYYIPAEEGADEVEANRVLTKAKNALKRKSSVDPTTGKLDTTKSVMADDEDIFVITSKDNPAKVERLPASNVTGNLSDVEYFQNKMCMSTPVPKSYLGLERDVNCLSLRTKIPCLDGKTRTLGDIINEYNRTGKLPYVYSWDKETNKIVPGEVTWAGVTRRNARVVEVELDDGSKCECTPEHLWFDIDGNEVRADDLTSGMQLLPLRRKVLTSKSYNGYERLYDPRGGTCLTHIRVAESIYQRELKSLVRPNVHHSDRDKRNNDPRNLDPCEYEEHMRKHEVDRFITLSDFRKGNDVWNKGLTKDSKDPMASRLRQTTYLHKLCLVCGKAFIVPLSKKKKLVCSTVCAGVRSGEARDKSVWIDCLNCGVKVRVVGSRIGRTKFCSKECKREHYKNEKNREMRFCEFCGTDFLVIHSSKRRFCCKKCSNTYSNKLRAGLVPVPNHRVKAIRLIKNRRVDTGDITVKRVSNFFIADASNGGVLVHNSKATLSWQDIEFARQLRHIVKIMAWFQRQVYDLQLQLVGIVPSKELYQIEYPPISFVDEELRMTIETLKWNIAVIAKGMNIPLEWILQHIVGLSEEDTQDLVVTIEPEVPQQGAPPQQVPNPNDAINVRKAVVKDAKLAASIRELKDMIHAIQEDRLNVAVRF